MAMIWSLVARCTNSEGTTTTYKLHGTGITVESRKRHIPHANGIGTWDHTSYWVLSDGVELKEKMRLMDAKEWAEEWVRKLARDQEGKI